MFLYNKSIFLQMGPQPKLVSRGQTTIRCGDGCKLITRFGDASFQVELSQVIVLNLLTLQAEPKIVTL